MKRKKTNLSKIAAVILGLTMCLALMLGIAMASPTSTVYAADETQIDTLGVAFRKVEVGDTLDAAFEFENATTKTLKVPAGANYTATLEFVSKDGQKIKLWDKDDASLPWSRVETQFIEQNVAYYVRVCFKTNEGYKFVDDLPRLRSNMQVLGAELGKGKDVELWDSAGKNRMLTIVKMSFLITKGMTYIGNTQTVYPEIGKSKTGTIGIEGVDTGFFISGAPGPYTYEAKIAPIGTEIQTSNVFDKSNCYYQITAVNSMDYGTMHITATAADGKTCDIPVRIAAVSGGHEHTWVEKIEKIDFEHHGYTKCTDPACPGVAPAFDKNSQYAVHEFIGGCTEKCTTCGDLGNPNAKHNLKLIAVKPATCSTTGMNAHYTCEGCGKYFDEDKNETTEVALTIPATGDHNYGAWVSNDNGTHTSTCTTCSHSETKNCSGGTATCENKAVCSVCGAEYGEKLGHDWNAWVSNGDGTHTRTCKRDSGHKENGTCSGGKATCTSKAVCDVCRTPYGDTVPHNTTQYGGKDSSGHWDTCSTCDNKFNFEAHTPDREKADETNPVKCTKCDFVITPALGHIHNTMFVDEVGATCMKEGSKSYYKCSGCEVKFEDAEATRPVTDESTLALPKAHSFGAWKDEVPATAETEGVRGHKDCVFCEKHFDENGTELTDLTIAKLQKVEVTVAGGTGSGSYTEGDRVTVVADEPEEGKVFKGWQDAAGNLVSSDREYTFVAGGETRLTAVYENKPSGGGTGGEPSDPKDAPPEKTPEKEKEGLSGGAVAGIVVGSVAAIGLGGFSLFWFVMKKKTFAELLTAIRGIFAKK